MANGRETRQTDEAVCGLRHIASLRGIDQVLDILLEDAVVEVVRSGAEFRLVCEPLL
jgi:hypothetical protein